MVVFDPRANATIHPAASCDHRRVLSLGDHIPNLPLLTPEGSSVSLRAFEGEATALIFLRHLG